MRRHSSTGLKSLKFIVDGMLGKVTRWLRMLGYDVEYSNNFNDAELIRLAKKEKRILLTRDFELYQQATSKGIDVFYLEGESEAEKLAQLAQRFKINLDIDMKKSRCPKCNTRVKSIPKEEAAGKIQKRTLANYNYFWECPKCKQVYWQGAHWRNISETLKSAEEILEEMRKK